MATTKNKNISKLIKYKKMKVTINLTAILIIAMFLSACRKSDNKPEETKKDSTSVSVPEAKLPAPEQAPQNFDDFWLEFQEGIVKKDKNKLLEMCEFPLIEEFGEKISQKDFFSTREYDVDYYMNLLDCPQIKKLNKNNKYKFSGTLKSGSKANLKISDTTFQKEKNVYQLKIYYDHGDSGFKIFYYFAMRDKKYKLIGCGHDYEN